MSKTCKNTFVNLIWKENFRGTCKVLIKTVKTACKYRWRTLEVERFKQEQEGGEVLTKTKDFRKCHKETDYSGASLKTVTKN